MTGCKIDDMNEVADSGAVRRVIIVAPNRELVASSNCHLCHKRQQIVWDALGSSSTSSLSCAQLD